jgi:hypothetical protein
MNLEITNIQYHDSVILPPVPVEETFGMFELKVAKFHQYNETKQMHFVVNIDQSGSMSDTCNDGKTKMEHLLFTMENMLRILHQKRALDVAVTIISFDDTITTVFETQHLHLEELETLIAKLNQISPCGSTNIGLALETAYNKISEIVSAQPTMEIVHLFLTDGEITMGTTDINELKEWMYTECENICIGYGHSHDSVLLNQLVALKNGQYRFIDAIENAGLVYGEVLHDVLYKMLVDVNVECVNGLLYNYTNNTWQSEIVFDSLSSEQTKTLYIKTSNPENCIIRVTCMNAHTKFPEVYTTHNTDPIKIDLTHHIFRQATLALLYIGTTFENKSFDHYNHNAEDEIDIIDMWTPRDTQFLDLQTKLQQMMNKINEYMETHQLTTDLFLKTLTDDLYICMRTLGTRIGRMFTVARQNAQGRQQTYTCSSIDEYPEDNVYFDFSDLLYTPAHRNISGHTNVYTLSTNTHLTPYKTTGVLSMMSQLSQTNTEELY